VPVLLDGMAKRFIHVHFVSVPTAAPNSPDISRSFQVGNDALDGAFRDADPFGHVTHHDLRLAGDAKQNMRVVGEKGPARASPPAMHASNIRY
jgi:hypothetical protein